MEVFMSKKTTLAIIIGFKTLLIVGILASNQVITFGERAAVASDDVVNEDKKENDKNAVQESDLLKQIIDLPKISSDKLKKEELGKYFSIIEKKKAQLDSRVTLLEEKKKTLEALESSIEEKLKKIEEEIQYFEQTRQNEKKIQSERLDQLVQIYQKMPAKKAAPVFEQMDKDLVVQLFNKIPKKQTMNILSVMDPVKSVELTEYFGRIRSTEEYELLKQINSSLLEEFETCKTK